ncbi:hypothetical protein ACQY0O_004646 [Thecaphora frezii]
MGPFSSRWRDGHSLCNAAPPCPFRDGVSPRAHLTLLAFSACLFRLNHVLISVAGQAQQASARRRLAWLLMVSPSPFPEYPPHPRVRNRTTRLLTSKLLHFFFPFPRSASIRLGSLFGVADITRLPPSPNSFSNPALSPTRAHPTMPNAVDFIHRATVSGLAGLGIWGLWLTGAVWKSRRDARAMYLANEAAAPLAAQGAPITNDPQHEPARRV